MKKYVDMRQILQNRLAKNEILDPRLFDFGGEMHPDVREKILSLVQSAIDRTIKNIPGLHVTDIYLRGSSTGYYYREDSDLDVEVQVQNKDAPWLSDDDKKLAEFLKILQQDNIPPLWLTPGSRFIDLSFQTSATEKDIKDISIYSILHDKWKNVPDPHLADMLIFDDIWQEYLSAYQKIDTYLLKMQISGKLHTMEGIEELEKYYAPLYSEQRFSDRPHLIYKLLKIRGIIAKIQELISDSMRERLSLK